MKSFVLMSVLSLVLTGGVFGSGKCTDGTVVRGDGQFTNAVCISGSKKEICTTIGQLFEGGTFLCVKHKSVQKGGKIWECKRDVEATSVEFGEYKCEEKGGVWKWVKPEASSSPPNGSGDDGFDKQKTPPLDADKPKAELGRGGEGESLAKLMEKNQELFEPIVWGKDYKGIADQLSTISKRFNCAFNLRDGSKHGNYYSVFRGHGRQKSYEKTKDFIKVGCPNGEVAFGVDWKLFPESLDNLPRLKHFVWNLEFRAKKDNKGEDIVKSDDNNYLARWNWGWYQLPVKEKKAKEYKNIREGKEWYQNPIKATEGALEDRVVGTCNVGTNCRRQEVFFYKLANCNMRQLYDSRCLAWAQNSIWVREIINAHYSTRNQESKNPYLRENVVYAFIAEELLSRFDPYTYDNRKVRAVSPLVEQVKGRETLVAIDLALASKLNQKERQYVMKAMVTPDVQPQEAAEK